MAHSNNTIVAPVRLIQDIQPVLGVSGGLMECYGYGTVNKWALHKPVRLLTGYDVPEIPSADWLAYMTTKVREAGNNTLAPFALKVGTSNNIYEVAGEESAPSVDWVYQQPSPSDSFFRRMLDVNGYSGDANPPMNPVSDLLYFGDSINVLYVDTNDGEAGDTSIQTSQLAQLADYKLMVAVKVSASLWAFAVMSSVLSQSVINNSIAFALPTNYAFPAGTYDAYVVGIASGADITPDTWITQSDSGMRALSTMLPLPFASKSDCKFTFRAQAVAPTNVVYLSYTLYLRRDYSLAYIEFWAQKYGAMPSGFSLSVTDIVLHDDYETRNIPLTGEVFILNTFTYDGTTRQSTGSLKKSVASYGANAGDYPNITYNTTNSAGYTVEFGGSDVVYIDEQ